MEGIDIGIRPWIAMMGRAGGARNGKKNKNMKRGGKGWEGG